MVISNNAPYKITCIIRVRLWIFDEIVRIVDKVKHILNLKRDLIFLSTLDSKGYKYTGEGGILKVGKGVCVVT